MIIMMNEVEILDARTEDRSSEDNSVLSPESDKLIISQASPDNKISSEFALPTIFSKSVPRRNKNFCVYRMNRSLDFSIISQRKNIWFNSPNSRDLDYSYDANKSLRNLSRSAKIMRALSSNSDFLRHQNASIKKTLNFDSTPSPKKKSSFDESSSIDSINTGTPSPTLDKIVNLDSNSSDISVNSANASLESIDENQNQTPQQNRKITRISSDEISDTKENSNGSGSSPSTSLLRNNLKARIDDIVSMAQTVADLRSFKRDNRLKACGSMVSSTPRNLLQEFYNRHHDEYSSLPDNMMYLSPESTNGIKKSHKKQEELEHEEEQPITPQMDVSVRNENSHTKMELETNMFASTSSDTVFVKKSQKKSKSINKMLIYDSDDELPDNRLISDDDAEPKVTPTRVDLSKNRSDEIENGKIQIIDLDDYEENVQDNMHFVNYNDNKEDRSEAKLCDEVGQPLQEESSSIGNVDVINENRAVSPEPNSTTQNLNGVTTPENHINILEKISTESIKKSHKKIKHENGKALSKVRILHHTIEPEILVQDSYNDDQCKDVKSKTEDTTCVASPQNSDRPNTPENVNSSRLLLSQFNSVKKSHKKDKNSKRISGLARCHKYQEYRKRTDSPSQNYKYEKKIDSKILRKNKSFDLKEPSDVLPSKKKKSMNVTLHDDICEFTFSPISPSSKCENTDNEFKIYTPMRKTIQLLHVRADKLQEKSESAQSTSKEIDCSRCLTPIAHRFGKSKGSEDLTSEEYAKTKRSNVDSCISDNRPANTVNLEDEGGRSTPINMSTTELLCNIDSIKKSHKKDKHSGSICKRPILKKKPLNTEEVRIVNFANRNKERTTPSLKYLNFDDHCIEMGTCINMPYKEEHDEVFYDDPQPSTSRATDDIENAKNTKKPECLNTPPNSLNAMNYMKLLRTTSIKRSHKKERDCNAQAKYILLSEDHNLSDDGSIFDEEDKFNFESYNQESDNEIMYS